MSRDHRATTAAPRRRLPVPTRVAGWLDLTALIPVIALAATASRGLRAGAHADWVTEARPSVDALLAGHVVAFFQRAPVYGGSLLLRAPFMLLTRLWGGGGLSVYAMSALPCLAAVALLALWVGADMRRRGCGLGARVAALTICSASPLAILALQNGHPEELLGGVLCVAAVLCAQRDRAVWSGVLLGMAIANKQWAVVGAGPVLVALSHGRWRALWAMTVTATLLFAPFVLVHAGGFVGQTEGVATNTGSLFSPFQLWWSFGSTVAGGARVPPAWLGGLGHTLPIAIMVPLTAVFALRTRGAPDRRRQDAMLLLALLLLFRCALDPWDAVYYPVPMLTATLAWDATTFDRPPFIAAVASFAGWFVCEGAVARFGDDRNLLATAFAFVVVPAIGAAGVRLYSRSTAQASGEPSFPRARGFALRRG
jgi:hypothetical protein